MNNEELTIPQSPNTEFWSKERQRYLRHVFPLNRPPAFVIAIPPSSSGSGFSREDLSLAVELRNQLIENKNALALVHNEGDCLQISGVLLNPKSLEKLREIICTLSQKEIRATYALSLPQANDVQIVTVIDRFSTPYCSSVLALARGEKRPASTLDQIPVYQLAYSSPDKSNLQTVEADKKTTPLKSISFNDLNSFVEWPDEQQIAVLPETLFAPCQICQPSTLSCESYKMIKLDINGSGLKILQNHNIPDRQLIIAANFKLLTAIAEWCLETNSAVFALSPLGDSVILIVKNDSEKKEIFEKIIRIFAEKDIPDFFPARDKDRDKSTYARLSPLAQARYGHLTNIALPINNQIVEIYPLEGAPYALTSVIWDPCKEKELEVHHKREQLPPSTTLTLSDLPSE